MSVSFVKLYFVKVGTLFSSLNRQLHIRATACGVDISLRINIIPLLLSKWGQEAIEAVALAPQFPRITGMSPLSFSGNHPEASFAMTTLHDSVFFRVIRINDSPFPSMCLQTNPTPILLLLACLGKMYVQNNNRKSRPNDKSSSYDNIPSVGSDVR